MYPEKLQNIIDLFDHLPEVERRETLVAYSDSASKQAPRSGERFDLEDVRKDEECADTVGVYLQVDDNGRAHLRMTLGPEVQTLTRAMVADRVWESRKRTFVHKQNGRTINHTTGICHLGGATLDIEENYLIRKLFTLGLGMVCISNQARI